jgi:hypothetical protein
VIRRRLTSGPALFIAFAFAVMADPVSSVAYAIEAALRALEGDLSLLLPTIALVLAIIAVVVLNYQQIVDRFPQGGGAASAVAASFGLGWAFIPLGALLVDFVLTIAISVAAAASAVIAYLPNLADWRDPIALILLLGVAALTLFGHAGRLLFASMTLAFLAVAALLLASALPAALGQPATTAASVAAAGGAAPGGGLGGAGLLAILFAFPVGMALATGVEAPASAIAQLGQLDDDGKRAFGRWTLWVTLIVVGVATLGLTFSAVRLGVGIPPADSTMLAELARRASSPIVFALFQLTSAILLLAAASSSFQAGPGLLKALAPGPGRAGVLPVIFARTNRHHTPIVGMLTCLAMAASLVVAAGGRDQELVLFYAVAVFMSFFAGLAAMARLHLAEGNLTRLVFDLVGVGLVGFTLLVNLARGYPIVSVVASLAIGLLLYRLWVHAGRPTTVRMEAADGDGLEV